MKDRVFIIWSGTIEVAQKVKAKLENNYNYVCTIGGNSENDSQLSTVGDTVIRQMKNCNQAIVIFQNKTTGKRKTGVSNNLFFELGYVLASYGQKKVHCVKKVGDTIKLPSDFDNGFVESVQCGDDIEVFADKIVEYFINRQKMSVNENKMMIINNRYRIHEMLERHYSELGSKCSDYELAQYMLYYMQASMMFNDIAEVNREISEFKNEHVYEFSTELGIAVELCLAFFKYVMAIKEYADTNDVYIDEDTFFELKKKYELFLKRNVADDFGIFDEWAEVFIYEQLCFGYMLFANNRENDAELRSTLYKKCVEYGELALESMDKLMQAVAFKENHDDKGLLALLRAYVCRNIYISKSYNGEKDAIDWLQDSLEQRECLKNTFGKGTVDTQLYNNFCMEYYLTVINYIEAADSAVDEYEIALYKRQMKKYIDTVRLSSNESAYLHKINMWCNPPEKK